MVMGSGDLASTDFFELEIGGEKLKVGKVSLGDFPSALTDMVVQRGIEDVMPLRHRLSPVMFGATIAAVRVACTDTVIEQELFSVAGGSWMLLRCIQKYSPDYPQSKLDELCQRKGRDYLSSLVRKLYVESGLLREVSTPTDPTKVTTTTQQ